MKRQRQPKMPIAHWSHSSLMSYLRNPLAWYKRYVEKIYDMPSTPASVVGRAGHVALQRFYGGISKEGAVALGLEYLRGVPDFEINFGKLKTKKDMRKKREQMEREYLQATAFYLARPPRHKVLAVEVSGIAQVEGLALPVKAISDLVIESKGNPGAVDIVDHKFVESFSSLKGQKSLFVLQALFNYYTVRERFNKPVKRFIVVECKKSRNADGRSQLRKYTISFDEVAEEFLVFRRLINDASAEILRTRTFLPNPSDMFEGENSFDIYRMGLVEE